LTELGRWQAHVAGDWIKENVGHIDTHYTSEYIRAIETASLLSLDNSLWKRDFYLRERDWGQLDPLPYSARRENFMNDLNRKELDSFFWTPPAGESLASVCLRVDRVISTLHRECSDRRVLMVCHGELMWAFRVRLEWISQLKYRELDMSRDPLDKIYNCQILHYTRRNPVTHRLEQHLNWFRSICPWDLARSRNEWFEVSRNRLTSQDLHEQVETVPRVLDLQKDEFKEFELIKKTYQEQEEKRNQLNNCKK